MILVKDFVRKYGNNPKYIEGFCAIHKSSIYEAQPKKWHISKITGEDATIKYNNGDEETVKQIYLPDFLNDWYIGF